jgi:hypothetical protein
VSQKVIAYNYMWLLTMKNSFGICLLDYLQNFATYVKRF